MFAPVLAEWNDPVNLVLYGVVALVSVLALIELCGLRVPDLQSPQGVVHFRVRSKGGKIRFVPVHAMPQRLIEEYLAVAGHGADAAGPVFRA